MVRYVNTLGTLTWHQTLHLRRVCLYTWYISFQTVHDGRRNTTTSSYTAGVDALAELLNVDTLPLNEEHGETKPKHVVEIDEELCIGCTLCIQACPVDAILGASKVMTTVIASECTGCDLCIPVCPVDCIYLIDLKPSMDEYVPNMEKVTNV